jgi:hypothetical protein
MRAWTPLRRISALAEMLLNNQYLEELSLCGNTMDHERKAQLISALEFNCSLKALHLDPVSVNFGVFATFTSFFATPKPDQLTTLLVTQGGRELRRINSILRSGKITFQQNFLDVPRQDIETANTKYKVDCKVDSKSRLCNLKFKFF